VVSRQSLSPAHPSLRSCRSHQSCRAEEGQPANHRPPWPATRLIQSRLVQVVQRSSTQPYLLQVPFAHSLPSFPSPLLRSSAFALSPVFPHRLLHCRLLLANSILSLPVCSFLDHPRSLGLESSLCIRPAAQILLAACSVPHHHRQPGDEYRPDNPSPLLNSNPPGSGARYTTQIALDMAMEPSAKRRRLAPKVPDPVPVAALPPTSQQTQPQPPPQHAFPQEQVGEPC
jgi:hypothetical protein